MKLKTTTFDIVNILLMLFIFAIMAYPFIYIVSVSFSDTVYVVQNKVTFYPMGFNLEAYKLILKNEQIPRSYFNTIIYTVSGTFLNILMTSLAAYPLSKKNFFGRKFFMKMIIITMFFNGGLIPTYLLVNSLSMKNTIWALIIPNAIWTVQLLILKSFFETIDKSLYESAIIDGASEFRILFRIIIPLSKAAIASILLFYFMGYWNSYFLPMIYLDDPKKQPLQVVLRGMLIEGSVRDVNIQEGSNITPQILKNATIFVSLIPVLIIYPFAQKYFVKGIMLGSVKG